MKYRYSRKIICKMRKNGPMFYNAQAMGIGMIYLGKDMVHGMHSNHLSKKDNLTKVHT